MCLFSIIQGSEGIKAEWSVCPNQILNAPGSFIQLCSFIAHYQSALSAGEEGLVCPAGKVSRPSAGGLDALSSSKNTLKEVGCNQYLKITLNEKGSLFSRVYGLFTAPVKKEEAHRPVSKFPFKPLLCVLKGFRFFFSLSVTQAKHCPWELLSYMSATCCSYIRYFCPLRTTGSPPRLPLILPSLSHASSPCAPYGVSTLGQASSPSGEV